MLEFKIDAVMALALALALIIPLQVCLLKSSGAQASGAVSVTVLSPWSAVRAGRSRNVSWSWRYFSVAFRWICCSYDTGGLSTCTVQPQMQSQVSKHFAPLILQRPYCALVKLEQLSLGRLLSSH